MKNKKNIAYFIYAVLTAAILVLARKHFVELKGSSLDLAGQLAGRRIPYPALCRG